VAEALVKNLLHPKSTDEEKKQNVAEPDVPLSKRQGRINKFINHFHPNVLLLFISIETTMVVTLEDPEELHQENNVEPLVSEESQGLIRTMQQSFAHAKESLQAHAQTLDVPIHELGCTALAVLLNTQSGEAVAGQIGDGAILQLQNKEQLNEVVVMPETNDPQSTYVIGSSSFESALQVKTFSAKPSESSDVIFVTTDGLSDDLLYAGKDQSTQWARSVNQALSSASDLQQAADGMLHWLDEYKKPGSRDDRTLVVITYGKPTKDELK
jgi:serine/threonine protein phosphatase PrpC